jgi:threonine/homoserine/homoserine lactone efflux protein
MLNDSKDMNPLFAQFKDMMTTSLIAGAGLGGVLITTELVLKVLIGGATLTYIVIKALTAWKEYKRTK